MKNAKQLTTKVVAMLVAIIMIASMLPVVAFANEGADTNEYVYLSISFDGQYINDKNDNPMVYVPVALSDIAAVDLTEYGLDNMLYDADGNGNYETTALQLLIYAHEELWGGDWSDVNFDALPGSSYFKGGIFGFTENLVYFLNGDFPVDESMSSDYMTTGATSDRIVLTAGDFIDVASFECFSFLWDQAGGFHLFADENGNYVHDYNVEKGESLSVKLMHSFCDLMFGESWVREASDYEVYYGSVFGVAEGTVTTDDSGCANIMFPSAGTYYVWCDGDNGIDDGYTHTTCDQYLETGEPCIVSSPAYAKVTVTGEDEPEAPAPEQPRQPQDVSTVLNATMAQLAATVTAPSFGTNAGEWTVFSLARGNHFAKDNAYFTDYYNRIVTTVNEIAAEVNMNGALDKNKSTENSRLIVALSAIGKDARAVGNWNLVEAYSANGINWIRKQGLNGTIWTLIALDSGNYETSDPTIRQQCIDSILEARHNDGGWSLVTAKAQPSNVDITCMTLTALYPYRDQPAVAVACSEAIEWLSESQLTSGGFPYGQGETSESCAWAIVALTTWGINPDTDSRFIKDGNSPIDNLLTYYVEEEAMFEHGKGAGSNAMATDQATYALVAYDRFINEKKSLYDMSDIKIDDKLSVSLGLPAKINVGNNFNGIVSLNKWDNAAGYKLIDFIVSVPAGVSVTDVTASNRLSGGEVCYNLEAETGKLRVVYFDANENRDITVSGTEFPADFFTIGFNATSSVSDVNKLNFAISGMSIKTSSDSTNENSQIIVENKNANGSVDVSVGVVTGVSFSAVCLYEGDGVDIIPADKKAVAVAVTGVDKNYILSYNDGTREIAFDYNGQMSEKTGITTYVALVDSSIAMTEFVENDNYTLTSGTPDEVTFGDVNGDGVINAQDALATVDAWLRKGDAPTNKKIIALNVNGDSRVNTFDALGIVEFFVNDSEFSIVTKAFAN